MASLGWYKVAEKQRYWYLLLTTSFPIYCPDCVLRYPLPLNVVPGFLECRMEAGTERVFPDGLPTSPPPLVFITGLTTQECSPIRNTCQWARLWSETQTEQAQRRCTKSERCVVMATVGELLRKGRRKKKKILWLLLIISLTLVVITSCDDSVLVG